MTLITNYFDQNKIIIASDKRGTRTVESRNEKISIDKSTKLLHSTNYVIGVNGILITKGQNYLHVINRFVLNNENMAPATLIERIKDKLIPLLDSSIELNITISGVFSDELFSFYYQVQSDSFINCIEEDKENIRFNGGNSNRYKLFRQGFIFIKERLRDLNMINITDIKRPKLSDYKKDTLIDIFNWMYERFHENDTHYYTIGGKMDYYIINKTGKIEIYTNM